MSAMSSDKKPNILKQISYFLANRSRFLFMNYLMKHDIKEYVLKFKNPITREAITKIVNGDIFAAGPIMMLAFMMKKACGWVIGGSHEFAKRIEQNYISLGGKVSYQSKVNKLVVKENRVTGILLENGKEHAGDYFISCADGYDTLYRMLDSKYLSPTLENAYQTWKLFPPTIQISLGVKDAYASLPPMVQYILPQVIQIDPKSTTDMLSVRVFNFDPSMAPAGHVAMTMMVPADYDYWANLRKTNQEDYDWQKAKVASEVIDALNKKLPGIKGKVEVIDVATPVTYERYNNIWKGAWEGFWPNAKQTKNHLPSTLPGLTNFWMAGQWLVPGGGLPTALGEGIRVSGEIKKLGQSNA
jgi:phytoene dehydrogenase-like protein